jgi:hypothetical protein
MSSSSAAGAGKRKAISKTLRFEVFKRDSFLCQYCGAHPPHVVLQVDHILAVANGGGNDVDNLITACQPCNLGKGVRRLADAPPSLKEKAADIEEREAQLAGFQAIMDARRERIEHDVWRVLDELAGCKLDGAPSDQFRSTRKFVERLGLHVCLELAEQPSMHRFYGDRRFRYFAGACWKRIRGLA